MTDHDSSRRDFVKKALYVAPAILSLQATSALAKGGSAKPDSRPSEGNRNGKPRKPVKRNRRYRRGW
jgi:hypothetical protein